MRIYILCTYNYLRIKYITCIEVLYHTLCFELYDIITIPVCLEFNEEQR